MVTAPPFPAPCIVITVITVITVIAGEMPGLTIMPMVTISDTFCQLLRLPRSRCDVLEESHPALLFRLYRLLVIISERRLQDHRLRVTYRYIPLHDVTYGM